MDGIWQQKAEITEKHLKKQTNTAYTVSTVITH